MKSYNHAENDIWDACGLQKEEVTTFGDALSECGDKEGRRSKTVENIEKVLSVAPLMVVAMFFEVLAVERAMTKSALSALRELKEVKEEMKSTEVH